MGIEGRQMSDCSSDIRARRKAVEVGKVAVFREVRPDKAQALKPIEEAAEVFGAWQTWVDGGDLASDRLALVGECADVVQAVCNLLDALGVEDMRVALDDCRRRNIERGREYEDD